MKIGIDIDDTITNSWKYYIPIYKKIFQAKDNEIGSLIPYYDSVKNICTRTEYNEKLKPINDKYSLDIPLKENVKEVIDKLYNLGHSVVFITARNEDYNNPQEKSKQYLDKHNIKYEKLITYAYEKDKVCLEEGISLFIDDSVRNCKAVSNKGIEVILFDAPHNRQEQKFNRLKSWDEIYEYIKSR